MTTSDQAPKDLTLQMSRGGTRSSHALPIGCNPT